MRGDGALARRGSVAADAPSPRARPAWRPETEMVRAAQRRGTRLQAIATPHPPEFPRAEVPPARPARLELAPAAGGPGERAVQPAKQVESGHLHSVRGKSSLGRRRGRCSWVTGKVKWTSFRPGQLYKLGPQFQTLRKARSFVRSQAQGNALLGKNKGLAFNHCKTNAPSPLLLPSSVRPRGRKLVSGEMSAEDPRDLMSCSRLMAQIASVGLFSTEPQ